MKKLIASLLVLVFGATMVMAEVPAANAPQAVPSAFADVEGLPLDAHQADTVEGEGVFIYVAVSAGVGAVSSTAGYLAGCAISGTKPTTGGIVASAVTGAVVGFTGSAATIGKAAIGITGPFIKSVVVSGALNVGVGLSSAAIQTSIDGRR